MRRRAHLAVPWAFAVALGCASSAHAEKPLTTHETRSEFSAIEWRSTAEETYAANALSVVDLALDSRMLFWHANESAWTVVRGDARRPMSHDELFRTIGRRDLSKAYGERSSTGQWYLWGGLSAAVGGAGVGLYGLARESAIPAIVGGAAFLSGMVLAQIGASMQAPELSTYDAGLLVDNYNANLRMYLKLPALPESSRAVGRAKHEFALSPLLAPGIVGVGVGMRF